eukprot:gene134-356_t
MSTATASSPRVIVAPAAVGSSAPSAFVPNTGSTFLPTFSTPNDGFASSEHVSSNSALLTGFSWMGLAALAAAFGFRRKRRGAILEPSTSRRKRSTSVSAMMSSAVSKISNKSKKANVQFPPSARVGVLLVNIGSPKTTDVPDVREYLRQFLGDDRVIDVKPKWLKSILLQILLAVRPSKSAEAYKNVFTERGSPLIYHNDDLALKVQERLGPRFEVRSAMRYSQPYLDKVLQQFSNKGINKILVMPMFPQSASATTGSVLQAVYESVSKQFAVPYVFAVPPFFRDNRFIKLWRDKIAEKIGPVGKRKVEHLVISFHGVPERQCYQTDPTGTICQQTTSCCDRFVDENHECYRAQCFETARRIAASLDLPKDFYSVAFQSRLTLRNTIEWIKPYTDIRIDELAAKGVKKVAVCAPSFTTDCLETTDELGNELEEQFLDSGGEQLVESPTIFCANVPTDDPLVLELVERHFKAFGSKTIGAGPIVGYSLGGVVATLVAHAVVVGELQKKCRSEKTKNGPGHFGHRASDLWVFVAGAKKRKPIPESINDLANAKKEFVDDVSLLPSGHVEKIVLRAGSAISAATTVMHTPNGAPADRTSGSAIANTIKGACLAAVRVDSGCADVTGSCRGKVAARASSGGEALALLIPEVTGGKIASEAFAQWNAERGRARPFQREFSFRVAFCPIFFSVSFRLALCDLSLLLSNLPQRCLNADDSWADVMSDLLREAAPQPGDELHGLPAEPPKQGGHCMTDEGWCPSGAGSTGEICEHGQEGGQCHDKVVSEGGKPKPCSHHKPIYSAAHLDQGHIVSKIKMVA